MSTIAQSATVACGSECAGADQEASRSRAIGRSASPTSKRATSSIGFCVADRPMRTSGRAHSASSRSSDSARWLPRLLARRRGSRRRSPCAPSPASRRPRSSRAACRATPASSPGCAAAVAAPARARAAACRRCAPRCGSRRRAGPRGELGADAGERRLEVELDVVRQRLQRRDVDDAVSSAQPAGPQALPHQRVERGEECRQRLAGPVGAAISVAGPHGSPARRRPGPRSAPGKRGEPARRRRGGSRRARTCARPAVGPAGRGPSQISLAGRISRGR